MNVNRPFESGKLYSELERIYLKPATLNLKWRHLEEERITT